MRPSEKYYWSEECHTQSHGKPSPLLEKQLKDYGVISALWPHMFGYYCVSSGKGNEQICSPSQQGNYVPMQDSLKLLRRQEEMT